MNAIDAIIEDFEVIDDWEERYRYVIELGRSLAPLAQDDHNEDTRVRGCASQVWLRSDVTRDSAGAPVLHFTGDSDAHIVRGLIYIVLAIYSGQRAQDIGAVDAQEIFRKLGLTEHLTPQRSNGVRAMVERIKADARAALASAS
ncbi:MAG: SufE family protein [Alphaproteobacteria bacterium]|nr:SufE family protein [Alphaproteobacteria bacterium]